MNSTEWAAADRLTLLRWIREGCDLFIHPNPPVMDWTYADALEYLLEKERESARLEREGAREILREALPSLRSLNERRRHPL